MSVYVWLGKKHFWTGEQNYKKLHLVVSPISSSWPFSRDDVIEYRRRAQLFATNLFKDIQSRNIRVRKFTFGKGMCLCKANLLR